jgi:hypothetical protein
MPLSDDYNFTRSVLSTEIRGDSANHDWQSNAAIEVAFAVGPDSAHLENIVRRAASLGF